MFTKHLECSPTRQEARWTHFSSRCINCNPPVRLWPKIKGAPRIGLPVHCWSVKNALKCCAAGASRGVFHGDECQEIYCSDSRRNCGEFTIYWPWTRYVLIFCDTSPSFKFFCNIKSTVMVKKSLSIFYFCLVLVHKSSGDTAFRPDIAIKYKTLISSHFLINSQ